MKNRRKYLIAALTLSLGLMVFTAGCGQNSGKETESETVRVTESELVTEKKTEPGTEPETEPESDIAFTSQDKSIQLVLPDSTWKVTQDADEMRVFSSGAAMISIVHAVNESQMKNTASVARSEEELRENLTQQYPAANSFEIQSFEQKSSDTLDTYEYVVKYNATSMWTYAVTYGIMAENEAYVVTGTVTDDNKTLLAAVVKSVESFTVLNSSVFSAASETEAQTGQSESQAQDQSEGSSSAEGELKSLTEYGTSTTLYASETVNIRLEPSTETNDNIFGSLNAGEQVTVVGETSQWFKVNVNGNIGYISKAFLVSTPPSSSETDGASDNNNDGAEDQPTDASPASSSNMLSAEYNSKVDYGSSATYYVTSASEVNLRSEPGTDSPIVGSMGNGSQVTVIGETDNWYVVSVNGATAYISKSFVSSQDPGTSTNVYEGNDGADDDGDMGDVIDAGDAGDADGADDGDADDGSAGGNPGSAVTSGSISGTITSAGVDTIVIAGDDGNTYTVNTSDAAVDTADGIYSGMYVSATVNTSDDGTMYASSVTGY